MTWRDHARPIIARVLRETYGRDEKHIHAALLAAYPFGERKYHPYKIWLSEIRRQRHPEQKKPPRFVKAGTAAAIEADPRQGRLL